VQPTLSLAQNSPSDAENQEVSQMGTHMDVSLEESSVANDHDLVSAPLYAGTELNTVRVQSNVRVHIDNAATDDRSNNIPNQVIVLQSRPDGLSGMPMEPPTASRGLPYLHNLEHVGASSSVVAYAGGFDGTSQHYTSLRHLTASVPGIERLFLGPQTYERGVHGVSLSVGSDVPTSLFDGSSAELPCTVELKIWSYNIKNPYDTLYPEACHLTISHVVLCSEMGTHFSPCGRFLVACVACLLPQTEGDHGTQLPMQHDSTVAGISPTHHPLSSRQVIYELRVYSLEATTFGTVLASRAIRASHCLTSIQFSPTSEHILLAYGRRHDSLLRTIFLNGRIRLPIYTVLEVYRVSDMELVGVLPSALDEVNVACFHPSPGAGLVYGTKEGKLRILQHNGANLGLNFFVEQTMRERHVL
jgi:activator-of-BECN1-regulated-autophagy protein 1